GSAIFREATFAMALLPDHRRSQERVLGWRRRQCPFEADGAVPDAIRRRLSRAYALEDDIDKQQLRQPESYGADAGDHVEICKLQRIVGNAPRHAGKAEEVLHEEGHVEEDHGQTEVPASESLVVHVPGPLWQPV